MLFHHHRPYAFREERIRPVEAAQAARDALATIRRRSERGQGLEAFALHLAEDRTRLVTVEGWRDAKSFREDQAIHGTGSALFTWTATDGRNPTPADHAALGVIIIDLFQVWRPLVRPVCAFNIRNGRVLNAHSGCVSTTVLRGQGAIATYARWASTEDFLAAFTTLTGKPAGSTAELNATAARMTFGVVRPDYHTYELIESREARP